MDCGSRMASMSTSLYKHITARIVGTQRTVVVVGVRGQLVVCVVIRQPARESRNSGHFLRAVAHVVVDIACRAIHVVRIAGNCLAREPVDTVIPVVHRATRKLRHARAVPLGHLPSKKQKPSCQPLGNFTSSKSKPLSNFGKALRNSRHISLMDSAVESKSEDVR